jgi:hypothetical protein
MAAFASQRVGFFLVEGDLGNPDVELMRYTNNKVFADIAWVHLLYREKGFAGLKAILEKEPDQRLLLKGFELIHEGEKLLKTDRDEANKLIWQGNLLLLKQEQSVTVQNSFNKFSYNFKLSLDSLAWATTLDFDANSLASDKASRTSFEVYEQECRSALDFTRFEDRWAWTISEALPKWMAVEKTDARHKLSLLVLSKDISLLMMAINWLKRGRMTSLFRQVDLMIEVMSSASQSQRLATTIGNIMTEVLLGWVLLPPGSHKKYQVIPLQLHLIQTGEGEFKVQRPPSEFNKEIDGDVQS